MIRPLSAKRFNIPKLLDQKSAIKLLKAHGWKQETGGKHQIKMSKTGQRPITLPYCHGENYSKWLTRSILKQAGIK